MCIRDSSLTTAELRSLGDAYYNVGRYEDAGERFRALTRQTSLDAISRSGFAVAAAACDLKLKRLTAAEAEALPDTQDENGARRLYLLMELARSRNDLESQRSIVAKMESRFPTSPWLAEALYSSGNLYLLRHEYSAAVEYYSQLATRFPASKNAAAATGRLSTPTSAAADREFPHRQPASGQGASAGQRGLERLHRAGDCRRPGLLLLELSLIHICCRAIWA